MPPVTASWHAIVGFAQTFDGDKAIGRKECGQLANGVKIAFSKDAASVEAMSLTGCEEVERNTKSKSDTGP